MKLAMHIAVGIEPQGNIAEDGPSGRLNAPGLNNVGSKVIGTPSNNPIEGVEQSRNVRVADHRHQKYICYILKQCRIVNIVQFGRYLHQI